ncbi:MAG: M23 family metallopeptidase [Elainellaceae cyanobacterium]
MKRFLKPTGQLLSTAVLTSAALEPIAAAAQSVPQPPPPEGDSQADTLPSEARQLVRIDAQTKTIVSPEAASPREFIAGSSGRVSRPLVNDATGSPHSIGRAATAGNQSVPFRSVSAVTPLSHNQPSLPSSNDVQNDSEVSHARSPHGAPHYERVNSSYTQSAERLLAQAAPSLPSSFEERQAQVMSQAMPTESSSPSVPSDPAEVPSNSERNPENVQATQAWLDETLARLVERDRTQREAQLRENLVDSAHQQLSSRNVTEARRLANNPVLTESERTDLMEAIADVEDRRFYPFVSAERAAAATRPQSSEMPSQDWLMAQMNAYVDSNNTECVAVSAQLDGDGAVLADGQSQPTLAANSADEEFVSGGEFLAGIGHQAPSIYANKSDRPVNQSRLAQSEMIQSGLIQPGINQPGINQPGINQPGINQPENEAAGSSASLPFAGGGAAIARAGGCPPTLGQQIGGVTFAALSGYEWMNQSASQQTHWQMSFPLPVSAPITSRFGWRSHPIYGNRRFHHGVDFSAPTGTPVLAALPGRVQTSGSLNGYGLTVIIENEDLQQRNLYAHMSRLAVPAGTWVEQGSVIGWVGSTGNSTGPHLHFEVQQRNGNAWTAVDPLQAAAQMLANRVRRE